MKIAVIGPTAPWRGGIAHHTTLLADQLRRDHEVLFISFRRQYPRFLYPGKDDREPNSTFQENVEYLIDSVNPFSWLGTVRQLGKWRAEVVIFPYWVPFWMPLWFVLCAGLRLNRRSAPKITAVVHNALPHEPGRFDQFALRAALQFTDTMIAHAESEAGTLRNTFPKKEVIVTPLPTYAEIGQQTVKPILAHPSDKPLLLFCGLIRPYKGLDTLLDALPAVLEKRDLHLAIVGEMWGGGEAYFEQIERLGLRDVVTVENQYVSSERLGAWVDSAELVILPYRSATQSAVIQLAFGHQTPVITTRVGGLPEAVAHEITGLLVPPENPTALAAAINHYFDENLGSNMRRAIQQQQTRFSWQTLADHIVQSAQ